MPNHVITVITAPKEVLDALIRQHTPEELAQMTADYERTLLNIAARDNELMAAGKEPTKYRPKEVDPEEWFTDFNLLVPCDETKVFQGGCNGKHPHPKEDGSGFYESCWYSWNVNNWGTKWNAYSHEFLGERTLKFETAWSHPYPVLEALSRKFPEAEIDVKYADEDRGSNCAHYVIKGGVRWPQADDPIEGSEEALKFAVELWGQDWVAYQEEMVQYRLEEEAYEAAHRVETAVIKGEVL